MQDVELYEGVQIVLTDAGTFAGIVDGETVTKPTLRQLKKVIDGSVYPFTAYSLETLDSVRPVKVSRFKGGIVIGERNRRLYGGVYMLTDDQVRQLNALVKEFGRVHEQYEKRWRAVIQQSKQLTPELLRAERKKAALEAKSKKGTRK